MDPIESKEDLAIGYQNSIRNNHSSEVGYKGSHTNSYSTAGSRPMSHTGKHSLDNRDVINYRAIDYVQDKIAYRKTAAPKIVSFDRVKMNLQHAPQVSFKKEHYPQAKFVALPEIHKSLILSDGNGFEEVPHFDILINMSNKPLSAKNAHVYNIQFNDCRTVSYHYFISILNKITRIFEQNPNKIIVLACDKGVNRSVSMAIGLAIQHGSFEVDQALEYIQNKKNEKYTNWYSMNNLKFIRCLRCLEALNAKKI